MAESIFFPRKLRARSTTIATPKAPNIVCNVGSVNEISSVNELPVLLLSTTASMASCPVEMASPIVIVEGSKSGSVKHADFGSVAVDDERGSKEGVRGLAAGMNAAALCTLIRMATLPEASALRMKPVNMVEEQ